MRLYSRIFTALISVFILSSPAWAASGIAMNIETLFAPMGKQAQAVGADGKITTVPGRETTEWLGLTGFADINSNFRFLYGAHATLLGQPLFKADAAMAYMLNFGEKAPLQPYFYLGATPVISTRPQIPAFGINAHAGLGVDILWNNTLYGQVQLKTYLLDIYGEDKNTELNLHWLPASFSLSAGIGYIF